MKLSLLYITAKNRDEAVLLASELLEKKLIACANIIEGAESIYRWEGEIEHTTETILIAKTRDELIPEVTKMVKSLHSYEIPCVVAMPIKGGNPEFLAWIEEETSNK